MIVNKYPNRTISVNDETFLYFGGTHYLGMQNNAAFISIIQDNLKKWGTSYGSSRNSNVKLDIYNTFESYFADFLNFETSVSISSGTLASFLVKDLFNSKKFKSFHINNSHPSIILKDSATVFINGVLNPLLLNNSTEDIIITSDAILALKTQPTNFDFLHDINPSKKVTLLIDESHSLGILGNNGCGISSSINHPILKRKIFISSLSKSYGVSGGIIASDSNFISKIKNHALFIGASGVNPAYLQSIMDAKVLYLEQLFLLKSNLDYFYSRINNNPKYNYTSNYPVCYYPASLKSHLLNHKIITTNFLYNNNPINRIVINANHTQEDLDCLLGLLNVHSSFI